MDYLGSAGLACTRLGFLPFAPGLSLARLPLLSLFLACSVLLTLISSLASFAPVSPQFRVCNGRFFFIRLTFCVLCLALALACRARKPLLLAFLFPTLALSGSFDGIGSSTPTSSLTFYLVFPLAPFSACLALSNIP